MPNLCVIPVRGGSKGLPRKNAAELVDGMSLLEWTVRQAQASCLADTTVVSTEDDVLMQIASACGARVVPRPAHLASDESTTGSVVEDLLDRIDALSKYYTAITILQVTSPLRCVEDINGAVELFETGSYDSVVSACEYAGVHPAKLYFLTEEGAQSAAPDYEARRRQELPPVYRRNGAIFMVTRRYFEDTGRLWGGRTGLLQMPASRSLDIDTMEDLEAARRHLRAHPRNHAKMPDL
ncbi:MAG: cytidylyltransferase domain-containing protein [Minwuia sp.]|uniref:acylneuraminate cytidylyltransferase family protein n=1 Tax=Minwuia sp. TaxID=2493630 RepID=UPI003A8576FA